MTTSRRFLLLALALVAFYSGVVAGEKAPELWSPGRISAAEQALDKMKADGLISERQFQQKRAALAERRAGRFKSTAWSNTDPAELNFIQNGGFEEINKNSGRNRSRRLWWGGWSWGGDDENFWETRKEYVHSGTYSAGIRCTGKPGRIGINTPKLPIVPVVFSIADELTNQAVPGVRKGEILARLCYEELPEMEVATTDPGPTLGPVSVVTAERTPLVSGLRSVSLSGGALVEEFAAAEHRVSRKLTLVGNGLGIMKASTLRHLCNIVIALCPVTLVLLEATPASAVTPDGAPARSVKNLKLKVSANGRYLVDQESKPFFYLGDTCWLLFQRPNREELDEYLKDRAAKGFTVIQAYVVRGLGRKHPDGNSSLVDATPFIERDPTRPNEEFFKHVDYVVNRANELGLVMGLVTAKSWHVTDHPEKVFDEKNACIFGKFLGARYKNNAVLWFPGGDSAPGKYEAVWVAMAKGLKDGCGGTQLVCYHGQGSTSSSMWFHQADWLDFNSIQSGHNFGSDSYAFVSKDYALTPPKPTVDMEPAYENHPTGANQPRVDSHKVRTQAYAAMLAGAAGHGYGSLDLFYFYKDADGPFPKNGFQHWRTALAYEGSRQVGLMRRLFEQWPWHKLVPDQSVLASAAGAGPYRLVGARAQDGRFVISYTPRGQLLSIQMDKLAGAKVKARWYDPRDGSWREIGEFANTGVREFPAPSQGPTNDWALVLDSMP